MKSLLPKTTFGRFGFWVGIGGAVLLGLKFVGRIPLPTPAVFAIIFAGGAMTIWAFAKGDRSWLQVLLLLPIVVLALVWSIAEVIFPH